MYKVVGRFADMLDSSYLYEVGDSYPRKGVTPTSQRIKELSGSKNRVGKPLIKYIEDPKPANEEPEAVEKVAEEVPKNNSKNKRKK